MNPKNELRDDLEGLGERLRDATPARDVEAAAAERVWARLGEALDASAHAGGAHAPLESCADYRALVPAWNARRLTEGRRVLLEDHLRECVACRRALRVGAGEEGAEPLLPPVGAASPLRLAARWAVAATLLVAAVLGGRALVRTFTAPASLARVEQVRGSLFLVSGPQAGLSAESRPLQPGEGIRTARDSTALVRLADGSRVEMRERSELSLQPRSDGMAIRLARGSVIVEAARQSAGRHLFVATDDCLVSVVGTIFSVASGTKGSRVSVVEGEVRVAQRGEEAVLHPGDQIATTPSVAGSSVADDVAWSQDAESYREVLRRIAGLRSELATALPAPGERHSTRLLDLSPEGTVFYAAVPNLGETLATGRQFLKSRIDQDALLKSWWEAQAGAGAERDLDAVLEEVRLFSSHLGPEVAVSLGLDAQGSLVGPLVLAELKDPAAFRAELSARLAQAGGTGSAPSVRLLPEGPGGIPAGSGASSPQGALLVWTRGDVLAASPSLEALQRFAASPDTLPHSAFLDRIAESYREGAEYIVSADLHTILQRASENGLRGLPDEPARAQRAVIDRTGLLGLDSLVAEAKDQDGRRHDRLVIGFDGPRRGLASWLGEPAPMGGLEYVSPDAQLVVAAVVKEPAGMLEDLLSIVGAAEEANGRPAGAEALAARDAARAIAAAFGGEVVFALDGPLLPIPAWKLVFEAPDPARLDASLAQAADAAASAGWPFTLTADRQPGRTLYTLHRDGAPFDLHAAWDGGYFVAAPTAALLDRTLAQRSAGASLRDAPKFTALLPHDSYTDFSAILYEDLSGTSGVAQSLAGHLDGGQGGQPAPGVLAALAAFESSAAGPSLFCAYSEPDRIVLAGSSPATVASEVTSLLTFAGLLHPAPPGSSATTGGQQQTQ